MANITLKIDDELTREAKILAAKRGTSVSQLVAEELRNLVQRDLAYEKAKLKALNQLENPFAFSGTPLPRREELYDRKGLR